MFRNPLFDFLVTVGTIALVLLFLLYVTGNIHCWNFFGLSKGCVIG